MALEDSQWQQRLRVWAEGYHVEPTPADRERMWQRIVDKGESVIRRNWRGKQWMVGLMAVIIGGGIWWYFSQISSDPNPTGAHPSTHGTGDSAHHRTNGNVTVDTPQMDTGISEMSVTAHRIPVTTPLSTVPLRHPLAVSETLPSAPPTSEVRPLLLTDSFAVCEGTIPLEWPDDLGSTVDLYLNGKKTDELIQGRRIELSQGNYDVEMKGAYGTVRWYIEVYPRPSALFDVQVNAKGEVKVATLLAEPAREWWLWDGEMMPEGWRSVRVDDASTHVLTRVVENTWGCRDTAVRMITGVATFGVKIPNIITPNGDGRNDVWKVLWGETAPVDVRLEIWDAEGRRIFMAEQGDAIWDGTCGDASCPPGYYVYVVRYRFAEDHQWQVRQGVITLRY